MYADALKQLQTHPRFLEWSEEEMVNHISTMYDLRALIQDNFYQLEQEIRGAFNIHTLIPYAGMTDVVLRDAIGTDLVMTSSQEDLNQMFKNALLTIKNFFLNLWANVVSFFKQLFDSNSKTRTTLFKQMQEFDRTRSAEKDAKAQAAVLYIPTYQDSVELVSNLEILYNDVISLADVPDLKSASTFKKGIKLFGYDVREGVIYPSIPYQVRPMKLSIGNSDWSIENLKQVSQRVAMICTNAAELNKLKYSLEDDVKSSTRAIDKYITLGDNQKAEQLQYELNNKSLRSSYVFKCSVIFQSYVTQISTLLIDAWRNLSA